MQLYKPFLLWWMVLFNVTTSLYTQSSTNQGRPFVPTFQLFVDSTNTLSAKEIVAQPPIFIDINQQAIKVSYQYTYWLKGALNSSSLPDSLIYLAFGNLDEITLFFEQDSIQNGRTIHPEKRIFSGYPYLFPIDISKNTSFLIKINNRLFTESPILQHRYLSEQEVIKLQNDNSKKRYPIYFFLGITLGTTLTFFVYSTILFFFNQKNFYLYYSIYVLTSTIFFLFTFERYNHLNLFFSNYPNILNYYEREINTAHVLFYLFFFWSFFKNHISPKSLLKLIYYFFIFYAFICIFNLTTKFYINDPYFVEKNLMPNALSGFILSIISLYAALKVKSLDAKFVGIGFLIYLLGMWGTMYLYFYKQENPLNTLLENPHIFYIIGILGELFFFALALGYRNNQIIQQKENEKVQWQNLNELNQNKTKLYTNITHEFRTPLTVILGLADQLKEQPKYKIQERLQIIKNNGKRLLKLVNELMDLSQLDANNLKLHYQQANIITFLGFLTNSFKHLVQSKNIHLTFYAEQDELIMDFDEEKLQQIIVNLLHNAIKFTPEYGEITLAVKHLDGRVQISVKDNGVGISEAAQVQIFDRFFQVNDTSIKESDGSGIGLAIVKELVALMEGQIELKSSKDKGSLFTVFLPIKNNAPFVEKVKSNHQPIPLLQQPTIEKITSRKPNLTQPLILLVEDNPDVVYFMKSCLDEYYEIIIARNGEEGYLMATDLLPDLIITDIMMPKIDGFQLVAMLKKEQRTQSIPILITTAKATKSDQLKGISMGAEAYILKPFTREEILLQVEKSLRNKRPNSKQTVPINTPEDNQFLDSLYKIIEDNLNNENFHTPELAQELTMSRTKLFRKLKAILNIAPSELIRQIRVERAKKLLLTTNLNIGEIALKTGFKDQSYFTKVFMKNIKQTPTEFRNSKK